MKFSDMKVGTKVFGGFLITTFLLGAASANLITEMSLLTMLQDQGASRADDALELGDIQVRLMAVYGIAADAALNRNVEEAHENYQNATQRMQEDIARLNELVDTDAEQEAARRFSMNYQSYVRAAGKMITMMEEYESHIAGDPNHTLAEERVFDEKIRELDGKIDELRSQTQVELSGIGASLKSENRVADEMFDETGEKMITEAMTIVGAGIFVALLLALIITRAITNPLQEGVRVANSIAEGDLNVRVDHTSKDEVGQLLASMKAMLASLQKMEAAAVAIAGGDLTVEVKPSSERDALGHALKRMVESLSRVISEVRGGSQALSSASDQLASTAQDLSSGTSEQAASVEETASSLEEMSASIKQNSANSIEVEQMSKSGAFNAQESGTAVNETVDAMKNIAKKITIIEDIAYQTNLLALNAAIEAARAGDHGKGFAVVATEVRSLAERSQNAARDISELAGTSVTIAERSGELLMQLVPSIVKTAELVSEVAASSAEQTSGVDQINLAMSQVDMITQRAASASEELSATAEEMAGQARSLSGMIEFFRLNDGSNFARTSAPKAVVYSNKNSNGHGANGAESTEKDTDNERRGESWRSF